MLRLVIALLAVASLVACAHADIRSFRQFMTKYNKKYETDAIFNKRYAIFVENLARIEQLNMEDPHATYGVNKFSDLSPTEFLQYKGGVSNLADLPAPASFQISGHGLGPLPPPRDNPTSLDWTTHNPPVVTPVKDQGQCGSCWAFSTIGNIEGVWALSGKNLTSLAENELVDCTKTSSGCEGGWPFWALSDVLKAPYNGQIDTEAAYPYVPKDKKCDWNSSASAIGAKISSYTSYSKVGTTPVNETTAETLLNTIGPISICLNATPMQSYTSGISTPKKCDPTAIDHCVLLVGYGVENNVKFWKIKNSWGESWGEKGFYRLIKGADQPQGTCGVQTVLTSAVV